MTAMTDFSGKNIIRNSYGLSAAMCCNLLRPSSCPSAAPHQRSIGKNFGNIVRTLHPVNLQFDCVNEIPIIFFAQYVQQDGTYSRCMDFSLAPSAVKRENFIPKQSPRKRSMVWIYNITERRLAGDSYVIDFTASWSFGEQQVSYRPWLRPYQGCRVLRAYNY
jgi:hypothetical protein